MKKLVLGLVLLGSVSFGKTLYADKTNSFKVCIAPNTIFSVDTPCRIKSLSFSNNVKGNISNGSPHTAFFMVIQNKENKKFYKNKASFSLACKDMSYSFVADVNRSCTDNHYLIINPLAENPSKFNKQDIINIASGLMRAMIKGEVPFGFRRISTPYTQTLYNNDIVMNVEYSYIGSNYIGLQGYIINKSNMVSYELNIPLLMQKGWILLYLGTNDFNRKTIIRPHQAIPFDVVAIKEDNQGTLPYKE